MSAKQLRRLQERSDFAADGGSGDEGPEEPLRPAKARPSAFAMLQDSDSGSDAEEAAPPPRDEAVAARPEAAVVAKEEAGKLAPSKKGKKKKKGKGGAGGKSSPGGEAQVDEASDDEDALLESLAAANAAAGAIDVADDGGDRGSGSECVFAMSKADFSADRERRRLWGDTQRLAVGGAERRGGNGLAVRLRGHTEGRCAHHRRLAIVTPTAEEPWPRPEGCAEMSASASSSKGDLPVFRIRSTPPHTRARTELAMAQFTHDMEEVQELVRQRPFFVEGLFLLSDIYRSSGEHEAAFKMLRMAVYAVECGFEAGFSPFAASGGAGALSSWPRVALEIPEDDLGWSGWPWLGALWGYMLGLHWQSLSRTALEVGKLLLAMALPRDPLHVLAHLDAICLGARQCDYLLRLCEGFAIPGVQQDAATVSRLDCVLPNFAYSAALARRLRSEVGGGKRGGGRGGGRGAGAGREPLASALNRVEVAMVLPPAAEQDRSGGERAVDDGFAADESAQEAEQHAALMRAMLLFPQVVRPLLGAAGVHLDAPAPADSPYRGTWTDLLGRPPFYGFAAYQHRGHCLAHALLADGYAASIASLWRGDGTLAWLHGCAGRLAQMHESSLFEGELSGARRRWSESPLLFDRALADFADFTAAELSTERKAPKILERVQEFSLMEVQRAAGGGVAQFSPDIGGAGDLGVEDEEAALQRALDLSRAAEESRQRRRLIEEQEAELAESLQADRARAAGGGDAAVPSAAVAQLVEMSFDEEAARSALARAGGDVAAAIDLLTS